MLDNSSDDFLNNLDLIKTELDILQTRRRAVVGGIQQSLSDIEEFSRVMWWIQELLRNDVIEAHNECQLIEKQIKQYSRILINAQTAPTQAASSSDKPEQDNLFRPSIMAATA